MFISFINLKSSTVLNIDGSETTSTMTSQFIDTGIFITIAFWGVVPNIWIMILSQYLIKLCLAAADTPFFYMLTRGDEKVG